MEKRKENLLSAETLSRAQGERSAGAETISVVWPDPTFGKERERLVEVFLVMGDAPCACVDLGLYSWQELSVSFKGLYYSNMDGGVRARLTPLGTQYPSM